MQSICVGRDYMEWEAWGHQSHRAQAAQLLPEYHDLSQRKDLSLLETLLEVDITTKDLREKVKGCDRQTPNCLRSQP